MSSRARVELDALMTLTEEMWDHWDILFNSLDEKGWAQKHGKDWTFADVPYHLAYCERELVADAILQGPDVPQDRQVELGTMRELNAWNDGKFAKRSPKQPVAESLAQLEATRTAWPGRRHRTPALKPYHISTELNPWRRPLEDLLNRP